MDANYWKAAHQRAVIRQQWLELQRTQLRSEFEQTLAQARSKASIGYQNQIRCVGRTRRSEFTDSNCRMNSYPCCNQKIANLLESNRTHQCDTPSRRSTFTKVSHKMRTSNHSDWRCK